MDQQIGTPAPRFNELAGAIKQDRNYSQSQLRNSKINVFSSPTKESNHQIK